MSHHKRKIEQEVKVENKFELECREARLPGIAEILTEVRAIEAKLDSKTFGLAEIKSEVAAIYTEVTSKTHGLAEIKSEVAAIYTEITSTTHGLAEIKREVAAIEAKLDSTTFGLIEIKSEIAAILTAVSSQPGPGFAGDLTTGAVVADNSASSLVAKVLNNTKSVQTVVVDVWSLDTCPKSLLGVSTLVMGTMCSSYAIFELRTDLTTPPKQTVEYEVDFLGVKPGIYAWSASRSNGASAPLSSSNFIDANTFRHSELVPLVDP